LDAQQDAGFGAPQPLKVIVIPDFFQEQVDDDIAVIHEDPSAFRCPLAGKRQCVEFLLDACTNVFRQRFELAIAVTAAENEEIRHDRIGTQIKQDDILSLFVLYDIDNVPGKF
jgi:hypothetical protein